MLGTHELVAETASFVHGELDDLFGARGQADLAHHLALAAADDELDGAPYLGKLHSQIPENPRSHALALACQTQQQELGPDVVMVEALRFFQSKRQDRA